ncbi:conserved hypothetical protein [Chlamydia pneumoniae LPCoLN]|uniref:hypothetical protein n=1 Tax=Chlamydia pneumoniae TaxID=83558 RepID=UPI0001BD9D5A|nr:hypothetical protein [Chlamydia pneumoniae]ACZ32611.1 conserved hypothetical protein [Chlamydia pneumoniae LPCoLN]
MLLGFLCDCPCASWQCAAVANCYDSVFMSRPEHKPNIPYITKATRRGLRMKTLAYLASLKAARQLAYDFLKDPGSLARLAKALIAPKEALQEGNLFFYGCSNIEDILEEMRRPHRILLLGFSYCQKPKACPEGRFNDACRYDPSHPTCASCSIGTMMRLNARRYTTVIIPTFIDIAKHLHTLKKRYPGYQILFAVTACELSLKMFGDYASVMNLKGVGIRLTGRICNTFKAFKLAERGVKPGVTILEEDGFEVLARILTEYSSAPFPRDFCEIH